MQSLSRKVHPKSGCVSHSRFRCFILRPFIFRMCEKMHPENEEKKLKMGGEKSQVFPWTRGPWGRTPRKWKRQEWHMSSLKSQVSKLKVIMSKVSWNTGTLSLSLSNILWGYACYLLLLPPSPLLEKMLRSCNKRKGSDGKQILKFSTTIYPLFHAVPICFKVLKARSTHEKWQILPLNTKQATLGREFKPRGEKGLSRPLDFRPSSSMHTEQERELSSCIEAKQ